MKIKLLSVLAISIFTSGAYAADNINDFVLIGKASIEDFSADGYTETYKVSPGAIYGGTSVYQGTLQVITDRIASFAPAEWAQNGLAALGIPWTENYATTVSAPGVSKQLPEELNFAILGTLSFSYELSSTSYAHYSCKNVYLAQGHSGNRNNWWMFNNTTEKFNSLFCTNTEDNTTAYFTISSGSGLSANALKLTMLKS